MELATFGDELRPFALEPTERQGSGAKTTVPRNLTHEHKHLHRRDAIVAEGAQRAKIIGRCVSQNIECDPVLAITPSGGQLIETSPLIQPQSQLDDYAPAPPASTILRRNLGRRASG